MKVCVLSSRYLQFFNSDTKTRTYRLHRFLIRKRIYWSWESCCYILIISISEGKKRFQNFETRWFLIDHCSEFAMFSLMIVWLYVHYQTMVHYQIFYIMLQINYTSLKEIAHCFLFSKSLNFQVIKVFYNNVFFFNSLYMMSEFRLEKRDQSFMSPNS